jgi:hypothetical protein
MTRFIVQTAIEAEERDEDELEQLFAGLDARLAEYGDDPLGFEEVHVKATAWAIAKDLGVDPGPEWWEDGWRFSPPPQRSCGGGGPPNGGGGGRPTAASKEAFASAPSQTITTG